jgi:hypothetical protein
MKEKPNWTTGKKHKKPQVSSRLRVPATGRNQIILKVGSCWIKRAAVYHPSILITYIFCDFMIYGKKKVHKEVIACRKLEKINFAGAGSPTQ